MREEQGELGGETEEQGELGGERNRVSWEERGTG